ncbi:alpha/beta fold hydrolase [Streptomyces sp. MK37H]|uniref:alpha/beta fold hydrolase n=1 Tax=Streptomyces sp. MK37H TaxID=2699117 RepID=UPI001FFBC996|nr:hypothetical protein [Streptomyces sp. MK37H]
MSGERIDYERMAAAVASGDPLVEHTMRSLGAAGEVDDLYAESAATFLAVHVLTCGVRPPKAGRSGAAGPWVHKAVAMMRDPLGGPLTVADMAAGLHLTMPVASPLPRDRETATPAEARMIERRELHLADGYGFGIQMGTRPQTLGYALVDSPAGLAAWLGEKFAAYADTRAEAGGGVSLDRQAEGIALYWLTGTGVSSARWYWEALRWTPRSAEEENALPVTVPTACTLFPAEPWPTARRWAERRYTDLRSWHEMEIGGHFPGLEQPQTLVRELRDAFRGVR